MKRHLWIPVATFILGVAVAGFVFVYLPERNAPAAVPGTPLNGLVAAPAQSAPQAPAPGAALDFVSISQKVGPAVVQILVEKESKGSSAQGDGGFPFDDFWERFFGRQPQQRTPRQQRSTAQGTGFFISPDGFILTNNHIAEDGVRFEVTTNNGTKYEKVKVVGTDSRTDLALLKVDVANAPYVTIGDSDKLQVGEWVLAIGNPYGLEHTVTAGIVSAKGRNRIPGDSDAYQDFIQTDTAINRGNSGGPLINMRGEVIGITSSIFTPTGGNIGIGFAIPSNMARKVVDQLRESGRVVRGWLGVVAMPVDQGMVAQLKLKERRGAVVTQVEDGSPAAKAGVKPYDVIMAIDGKPIQDNSELRLRIADVKPGTVVRMTVVREGREIAIAPKIAALETGETKAEPESTEKNVGLTLRALTPELARRFGTRLTEGLLITEVEDFSEAARKGLQPGMVVLEVNQRRVTAIKEFEDILRKTPSGQEILLLVGYDENGRSRQIIVSVRVP